MKTTLDRFYLRCKVEKRRINYLEVQSKAIWNEEAEIILLVPDVTDEATNFFDVWLPVDSEHEKKKYSEIGFLVGNPINDFVRGAVEGGNIYLPAPHIFVMTKKAEEKLKNHVGERIDVVVLGEEEVDQYYDALPETESPIEGFI